MSHDRRAKLLARQLNAQLNISTPMLRTHELKEAYRAVFELIDQPWDVDFKSHTEKVWKEGYEQAIIDVCDAIADEWGVVDMTEEE